MLDSTFRFLHHKMLIIEIVCNSWGRFFFALLNDGTYIFPFEKTSANAFKHHWASINFFSRLNVFILAFTERRNGIQIAKNRAWGNDMKG